MNSPKVGNENFDKLNASYKLDSVGSRNYALDNETAPRPQYLHYAGDKKNVPELSFLNINNKRIYIYDYKSGQLKRTIDLNNLDLKGPFSIKGYFIQSLDSIYLYDEIKMRVLRINHEIKVADSISLTNNSDLNTLAWTLKYPQYQPTTSSPFLKYEEKLLLTGMHPWALEKPFLEKLALTAKIDLNGENPKFINNYPSEHYGSEYEWDDPIFTTSYTDQSPHKDKLVISFPISHHLYISDITTGKMKKVYAGSNYAKGISSLRKRDKSDNKYREKLTQNVIENDLYAAVKYDKYRNIYYRFIRRSLVDINKLPDWKNKQLGIIMMDDKFNYLGETNIGTLKDWNWENSFVSEQGLNIERIDRKTNDESLLQFQVFLPKKL